MGNNPARIIDRLSAFLLYLTLMTIILFAGSKLINYALDAKFYHLFLLKWETTLNSFATTQKQFPVFTGGNHTDYMDNLVIILRQNSILIPHSNTGKHYIYQMSPINPFRRSKNMFILCFKNRIIIYNMPEATFKRLDKFIDGKHSMTKGAFVGKKGKNEKRYIGYYKL